MTQQTQITNQIVKAIDAIYPDWNIIDEAMEQDIEPPRFYITCYQTIIKERIQNAGFFLTLYYEILFDPGVEHAETICDDVAFNVMTALRKVSADGFNYRGNNIKSEFDSSQGVLHVYADFIVDLKEEPEEVPRINKLYKNTKVEEIYVK